MKMTEMKIADLKAPEKNVRIHTISQINEFKRSLEKFGQTRLAVIDENNVVLIGNGMIEALKELGRETVFVYKKTDLSENEKKQLMIADNKIFNLGIDNINTINEFLSDLQTDLDIPGYSQEMLETITATATEVTEKLSEYGTLDEEEIEEIKSNSLRKEQNIEKAKEQASKPADEDTQTQGTTEAINDSEESKADEPPFIVCPKCGEKIWL